MQHVQFETTGAVAVVTMNRPKANPLNGQLLAELLEAFELAAADEDVRAVLFSSAVPRFFSAGFDAMEVFSYNREQMTDFLVGLGTTDVEHTGHGFLAHLIGVYKDRASFL